MRNFRELTIWKQGIQIALEAYRLANLLPRNEEFGLKSQIKRASISISANIAEGCSRNSDVEYKRFLEVSLGSSFEVETHFIIASKLGIMDDLDLRNFLFDLTSEQKQINSLITKIKSDIQSQKFTAKSQRPKAKS